MDQRLSHYMILEKHRHSARKMADAISTKEGGQPEDGGMFENHPRTFHVSGCDFQRARFREFTVTGGNRCLRAEGHFGKQAPKRSAGGGAS